MGFKHETQTEKVILIILIICIIHLNDLMFIFLIMLIILIIFRFVSTLVLLITWCSAR